MAKTRADAGQVTRMRKELLEWYESGRRDLPWRRSRDPYAIWVSEIMLQQTRVAVVIERYQAFMARFPTLAVLARASEQDVLALWSGLGYYRRARMLHAAAQAVMADCDGIMAATAAELRKLPGIGGYTSAAIASIAHSEPVAVVDGNVERVLCRLAGWDANGGKGSAGLRSRIEAMAARLLDPERPGDFNQAVMELGAMVCLPRNPQCLVCPLSSSCKTRGEHKTAPRPRIATREVAHALCVRTAPEPNGGDRSPHHQVLYRQVLLEQRPAGANVMPGLWELPALRGGAGGADDVRMTVRHAIMQVNYIVRIHEVREEDVVERTVAGGGRRWVSLREAGTMALTGLARKVLHRAQLLPRLHQDSEASKAGVLAVM
jgi:A/G-specific adenine glycosylase